MMSESEVRWLVIAAAALGGLVIGSFLNVVVYRAPRGLSVVRPGSFCPLCSTPVQPFDNVPVVSWLLLRGRCRSCGAPISPRYPLVEAGTGLLFALVAAAVGPHPAVAGLCAAAAGAAAALAIELDGEPVPPAVPVIAAGLGLAALAAASGLDGHWPQLTGAAIGAGAGAGALCVAGGMGSAPASTSNGTPLGRKRPGGAWALVPAGTVIGWTEPIGAAVGAVLAVSGVAVLAAVSERRTRSTPATGSNVARLAWTSPRIGPASVAMAAAAGSVIAALAAGTGLS